MTERAIDIEQTRQLVVDHLDLLGWQPRDADQADFTKPGHPMRFKVGTKYGEVSITVWRGGNQVNAIRITRPEHLKDAKRLLAAMQLGVR